MDFPGDPVVKNPPANAEDMGLIPGPGRFHMQLSLCTATTKLTLWNPCTATTEATHLEAGLCNRGVTK